MRFSYDDIVFGIVSGIAFVAVIIALVFIDEASSNLKISGSYFSDSGSYLATGTAQYEYAGKDENALSKISVESKGGSLKYFGSINYDLTLNKTYSYFTFVDYSKIPSIGADYYKAGIGVGFVPDFADIAYEFPYRYKISFAMLQDSNYPGKTFLSIRQKYEATVLGIFLKATMAHSDHFVNSDLRIAYKLTPTSSILWSVRMDELNGISDKSQKIELEVRL